MAATLLAATAIATPPRPAVADPAADRRPADRPSTAAVAAPRGAGTPTSEPPPSEPPSSEFSSSESRSGEPPFAGSPPTEPPSTTSPPGPSSAGGIAFREVAAAWGVDFRHRHGGSGRRYMVETMVGGVAVLDFDGDGDLDLFFVDGGPLPGYEGPAPRSRLLRNDGPGTFVDWTGPSAIAVDGYGSGVSYGDIDGDGDLDLYVTALGPNRLFVNRGDGSFEEAGEAAGVADPLWGASSAFADPDLDGDLDLYVANYVDFTPATHRPCTTKEHEVYCHPGNYEGQPDRYFENLGGGVFADATATAGLVVPKAMAGLGVVFADVDVDGWPDLYVANDAEPNFLFRNLGGGRFEEQALLAGAAYGEAGRPEAGMGVDLGDVDGDGLADLVVTNFELETNALYRNLGAGLFLDLRFAAGVAESSLFDLAFGVAFADFDHDADLDLAIANGHILDNAAAFHERSRYAQPNRILVNREGRFALAAETGVDAVRVSRGLATGDLDGDGDLELVIVNSNDSAEVYENRSPTEERGWLLAGLRGSASNRFGVGARVTVSSGRSRQVREARSAASYLSQGAHQLHFGLGPARRAQEVEIAWPSGRRQRVHDLPANRRLILSEPAPEALSPAGAPEGRGAIDGR